MVNVTNNGGVGISITTASIQAGNANEGGLRVEAFRSLAPNNNSCGHLLGCSR